LPASLAGPRSIARSPDTHVLELNMPNSSPAPAHEPADCCPGRCQTRPAERGKRFAM